MIAIGHEVKASSIHGVGLFTKQDINQGVLIAKASPKLDLNISFDIFDSLDDKEKAKILYWGYFDARLGRYHVDFDDTRFINHSKDGNVTRDMAYSEMRLIAKRNIRAGEELTQNYLEFESKQEFLKRGIKI